MTISEDIKYEIRARFDILEEKFQLDKVVQRSFFNRNEIWKSEIQEPIPRMTIGALYELSEEEKKIVQWFEYAFKKTVYHIILSIVEGERRYAILYVSDHPEEWDMDKNDLKEGLPCVYVYNADNIMMSEFGTIGISKGFGGIIRVS